MGEVGCHARANPESRVVFDRNADCLVATCCVSHHKVWCKIVGPPYQPQVIVPIVLRLEIKSKDPRKLQRFQKPFEILSQMFRKGNATSDIAHIENHGNERVNDSPLNCPDQNRVPTGDFRDSGLIRTVQGHKLVDLKTNQIGPSKRRVLWFD